MKRLNFKYPKTFLGRNGEFKSIALDLSGRTGFDLTIYPITSKGITARCRIEIPATSIIEFVNTLKEAYADEFKDQEIIERVGNCLCDSEDDDGNEITIEQQIELIRNYEGDENDFLDNVEGVCVWEKLEYAFTVKSFIQDYLL